MRRVRVVLLVASTVVVAGASLLGAQTLPLPILPPPTTETPKTPPPGEEEKPPPEGGANAGSVPRRQPITQSVESSGQARPRPWEYTLGVGVAWDSNIDFVGPGGPSSLSFIPSADVARVVSNVKGQLRAEAGGSWVGYSQQSELNRHYLDFGLRGDYQTGPHTNWRGDAHYWIGYTDQSPTLIAQGVPLPLVETRTFTGELTLMQEISPRTSLRVDGRIYHTSFDSEALINGDSLRGTVGIERKLSPRDAGSIVYGLESASDQVGSSYLTHYGSLQWRRTLSPQSAILIEGGISYTPQAAEVGLGRKEGFYGGLTFLRRFGRSNLTAYLRHEVAPAFGLGFSRLETRAGVQGDVPVGRNWRLRVDAYHTHPETPADQPQVYPSSSDVFLAVARRLGRLLSVAGEGRYRRRGVTVDSPAVDAYQAGVTLTLGSPDR